MIVPLLPSPQQGGVSGTAILIAFRNLLVPGVIEWGRFKGYPHADLSIDFCANELRLSLDGLKAPHLVLSAEEYELKPKVCKRLAIARIRKKIFG